MIIGKRSQLYIDLKKKCNNHLKSWLTKVYITFFNYDFIVLMSFLGNVMLFYFIAFLKYVTLF